MALAEECAQCPRLTREIRPEPRDTTIHIQTEFEDDAATSFDPRAVAAEPPQAHHP